MTDGAKARAVDSHAHVFGPFAQFPLPADAAYAPPEASAAAYVDLLDTLGCRHGVLVQGSAHQLDNRALLAAIACAPDRLRGIAVVRDSTEFDALADLAQRGIVGLRFFGDGDRRYGGGVGIAAMRALTPWMRELALHAQLFATVGELLTHEACIDAARLPLVIDHFGRPDLDEGIHAPGFQRLLKWLADGHAWVKLSGDYRLLGQSTNDAALRPFHDALVAANPERLLWGSDWPHVNFDGPRPDASSLLAAFVSRTPDPLTRQRILCDNPAKLFGFAAPA